VKILFRNKDERYFRVPFRFTVKINFADRAVYRVPNANTNGNTNEKDKRDLTFRYSDRKHSR